MTENALAEFLNRAEYEEKVNINTLASMLRDYCDDNPLLDVQQKNYTRGEEEYLTAEELYKAYTELEDYVIEEMPEYPEEMLLEWVQEQLGERYKAFHNIYLRRHKEKPDMSEDEYLKYFETQMEKLKKKLEFGWFYKGFTATNKEKVEESLAETVLYLRSIGQWKLADEVLLHYKDPLEKPKLPKSTAPRMVKLFTLSMVRRCKIPKKEAEKLLQKTISKLF